MSWASMGRNFSHCLNRYFKQSLFYEDFLWQIGLPQRKSFASVKVLLLCLGSHALERKIYNCILKLQQNSFNVGR
jgi:hypothetical protein